MMLHRMSDHPSDSSPSREWPKCKVKFCNVPRLCIGFNLKGSSDSVGVKSPTSPLDIKTFSGVGINHSRLSTPKQQRETIPVGFPHAFSNPTSQSGMKPSERYTCVTSHGPKLSTKHMYTHCATKCETVQCPVRKQHEHAVWDVATAARSNSNVAVFPVSHFLRACYLCKRHLNHGKDIYMYRGDQAFCSVECRYKQILMNERTEKISASPPYSRSDTSYGRKFFIDQTNENCPSVTFHALFASKEQ